MTLLLMAAGSGSRYGKLKQFDELGPKEEFLMEFSIYDAIENGFDHIVVITKKENVSFLKKYLADRLPQHIKLDVIPQEIADLPEGINFVGERQKPWGTAHAVWSARNVISNPFVVINADDYYGQPAFKSASQFIRKFQDEDTYGLVAYTLKDTLSEHGSVSRGVCEKRNDGTLLSVKEYTKIERKNDSVIDFDSGVEFEGDEMVSMNFWICKPSLFLAIEQDLKDFFKDENNILSGEVYLPFVIQEMLQQQKVDVRVIPSGGNWFGVTYASDKEKAMDSLKKMTENGDYISPLWK